MSSLVIVSGPPGSGKTHLSQALARSEAQGLHLHSDSFYEFPTSPIDPTTPESRHQNTVIMRALARSAGAFMEGNYQVFLDGVIGPWFLPVLREELPAGAEVDYLVLRVPEAVALQRVRQRDGPGASSSVLHMLAAFEDLAQLRGHAIDTGDRTPEQVLAEARRGLREGRFTLRD